MENEKIEKAIQQAQASLKIDGIVLKKEFIDTFRAKKTITQQKPRILTLKRSDNYGRRRF